MLGELELVGKIGVGLYKAITNDKEPTRPWKVFVAEPCSAPARGKRRMVKLMSRKKIGQRVGGRAQRKEMLPARDKVGER